MTVELAILNPLGPALTTCTSGVGHHVRYGGQLSRDLDVVGRDSRGHPVVFDVGGLPSGFEVRGRVGATELACKSGRLADGGLYLRLDLEHMRTAEGVWYTSDTWILFSHLDPITTGFVGSIVQPGDVVGHLGPAGGAPEYASSCAQGSHLHLEVLTPSRIAIDEGELVTQEPVAWVGLNATPPSVLTIEQRFLALEARVVALEKHGHGAPV